MILKINGIPKAVNTDDYYGYYDPLQPKTKYVFEHTASYLDGIIEETMSKNVVTEQIYNFVTHVTDVIGGIL